MAHNINWSFITQIGGGPSLSLSEILTVGAYDVINVEIDAATAATPTVEKAVEVQPSASGKVQLLVITANVYHADLSCRGGGLPAPPTPPPSFKLKAPLVLVGAEVLDALKLSQQNLTFSHKLTQKVTLTIIVGRDV